MDPSPSGRWWCHSCEAERPVRLLGVRGQERDPVCASCAGNFVEQLDGEAARGPGGPGGGRAAADARASAAPGAGISREARVSLVASGNEFMRAEREWAELQGFGDELRGMVFRDVSGDAVASLLLRTAQLDTSGVDALAGVPVAGAPGGFSTLEELVQHLSFQESAGRSSARPVAAAVLESLPQTTVGAAGGDGAAPQLGGKDCCICMCEFEPGEAATTMPCGHSFHAGCIKQWLAAHHTCPVCREPLATDDDVDANVDPSARR